MRSSWPALDIQADGLDWDLIQAALTDFDVAAIDENAPDLRRVFFHSSDAREHAAAALGYRFPHASLASVDVPDEDWAARSQADLRAVRVGNIVVAPPWDVGRAEALPHPSQGSVDVAQGFSPANSPTTIVIQPSMGFGTGHHATTRLCLAHLQHVELRNRTVVDIGTGSGVLAITASRLGAMHVLAIDDDPDAIESARENVALNPGADVTLQLGSVQQLPRRSLGEGGGRSSPGEPRSRPREGGHEGFDIVVANLTGALLVSAAGSIQARAAANGRLILSGFLVEEETRVLGAFGSCTMARRSQEDEWGCVTLLRSR